MGPHGSFAFKFEENYTLLVASGSWNLECAEIYDALLRKRVESNPHLSRCIIIDGRNWELETPECGSKIKELHLFLSGYYKALYNAYYLEPTKIHVVKYLLDHRNKDFDGVFHWQYFYVLGEAVSWLNSKGFKVPKLTDEDFPEPIPADQYVKYL